MSTMIIEAKCEICGTDTHNVCPNCDIPVCKACIGQHRVYCRGALVV